VGRDEPVIEEAYKKMMEDAWIPEAAPFVRSLGNLEIGKTLWVFTEGARLGLDVKDRIKSIVECACCPIAHSGYVCDDATLWIDTRSWFYIVDSEGVMFVGANTGEALEVLLLGKQRPAPPEEICEAVKKNYE